MYDQVVIAKDRNPYIKIELDTLVWGNIINDKRLFGELIAWIPLMLKALIVI